MEELGTEPATAAVPFFLVSPAPKRRRARPWMAVDGEGVQPCPDELLLQARAHFAMMRDAIAALCERIRAGDSTEEKRIEPALRAFAKAMQTALDLEIDLEKRIRQRRGETGAVEIDLDAAKAEIRSRLARLRATADGRGAD